MENETFATWFKTERLKRGMSQKDFAKFLGITNITIYRIETSKATNLQFRNIYKICKKLDVSPEFIYNLTH